MSRIEQQDRLLDVLLSELLGGQTPPDLTAELLARAFPNSLVIHRRHASIKWFYAAAAVLMLGIGVWLCWYEFSAMNYPVPTLTGDGTIVDGGSIRPGAEVASGDNPALLTLGGYCNLELAPQTHVRIEGSRHAESVYLLDGQLTCDVQHNVGAFSVETEVGSVHVTGTRFRCTVADDTDISPSLQGDPSMVSRKLMVAVLSGVVTVNGNWGQTALAAGHEQAFFTHATALASDAGKITGMLAQIADNQLVLKRSTGNITINLTGSTVFNINGQAGAAGDLKTGMYILAVTSDGTTATEIKAYTPKPKTTATPTASDPNKPFGVVTQVGGGQLTLQNSAKIVTEALTDSTTFNINGQAATAADLKVGMHALAVTSDGKTATQVKAYTPKTSTTQPPTTINPNNLYGTVTQVGGGQLTLQNPSKTATVTLTDSTAYTVNGKPGTAADLQVGMHAYAITSDGKTATQVKAYTPKPAQ